MSDEYSERGTYLLGMVENAVMNKVALGAARDRVETADIPEHERDELRDRIVQYLLDLDREAEGRLLDLQ